MSKPKPISHYDVVDGKIRIFTPYCDDVVSTCKSWGGKFDRTLTCWIVPETRLAEVQARLGASEELVQVEVGWKEREGYAQLHVGWHILAGRRGRDYSANIYAELVAGTIPSSGGSMKNPAVEASRDARFRLWVPRDFAEARGLQIVSDPASPSLDIEALQKEREQLQQRLAEIDRLLTQAPTAPTTTQNVTDEESAEEKFWAAVERPLQEGLALQERDMKGNMDALKKLTEDAKVALYPLLLATKKRLGEVFDAAHAQHKDLQETDNFAFEGSRWQDFLPKGIRPGEYTTIERWTDYDLKPGYRTGFPVQIKEVKDKLQRLVRILDIDLAILSGQDETSPAPDKFPGKINWSFKSNYLRVTLDGALKAVDERGEEYDPGEQMKLGYSRKLRVTDASGRQWDMEFSRNDVEVSPVAPEEPEGEDQGAPTPPPTTEPTYRLSGGEGYGCRGWKEGQIVKVNPDRYDGHEYLYVVEASSRYISEDGMSFGVGDEEGYHYTAQCRPATDEESAPLRQQIEEREQKKAAEQRRKALAAQIREQGEKPEGSHSPEGERITDRQTTYGGGDWFVVGEEHIWYVLNNGADGDDWSRNNVRTGGAGAIGWRVPRTQELADELLSIAAIFGEGTGA